MLLILPFSAMRLSSYSYPWDHLFPGMTGWVARSSIQLSGDCPITRNQWAYHLSSPSFVLSPLPSIFKLNFLRYLSCSREREVEERNTWNKKLITIANYPTLDEQTVCFNYIFGSNSVARVWHLEIKKYYFLKIHEYISPNESDWRIFELFYLSLCVSFCLSPILSCIEIRLADSVEFFYKIA